MAHSVESAKAFNGVYLLAKKDYKPIFNQTFFGRDGAGNAIYYVLGTFQISYQIA